jgi:hypothetical protein
VLANHNYVISLPWGFIGNRVVKGSDLIDGCDLEHIVSIIEKRFSGENPCFAIRDNSLCVILSKSIGEWDSNLSGCFEALVQLGLIGSWKLISDQ